LGFGGGGGAGAVGGVGAVDEAEVGGCEVERAGVGGRFCWKFSRAGVYEQQSFDRI
jgi:hypothetical protein